VFVSVSLGKSNTKAARVLFHAGRDSVGAPGNVWFSYGSNKAPTTQAQGDKSNAAITIPTLPAQIPF